MKNPIFMIGMLIAAITIMNFQQRGIFNKYRENLTPTSCKAVRVKLDRRIPDNWKTNCIDGRLMTPSNKDVDIKDHFANDLVVNIYNPLSDKVKPEQTEAILYRELSNYLISIAKKSPQDNLENVGWVLVRIHHKDIVMAARTKGLHIVKLATLKDKSFIAQHLKNTVVVQLNKPLK